MKLFRQIWKQLNTRWFVVLIFILFTTIFFSKSDHRFGWTSKAPKTEQPIFSDGSGYFAYLPQWFIYHTSNFEFQADILEKYQNNRFLFNAYTSDLTGKQCNKYYPGTAIAMTPFFLMAHIHAGIYGEDQDGYSRPYLFWANIAGIAYCLLGWIALFFILLSYKIDRFWALFGVFILAFATNLSFYTNVYVPFSHVYSFAVITWFIYFSRQWAEYGKVKHLILFSALLGFAFLIRPTNIIIILLVPFFFDSTKAFLIRVKELFTKKGIISLLFALTVFSFFIVFQLMNIYNQSGEISLNTYKAEGFDNLLHPEIWNVLFSWSKGLFIYAPVLLLMIPGLFVLYKKERRLFWGIILFFFVFTYLTASWWCWWYGGGLGMRPFIDVYALLVIPIVFLLKYSNGWIKFCCINLIVLATWMYQVYDYQMRNNILHYDKMSKEQFFSVFMKADLRYGWSLHFEYDQLSTNKKQLPQEVKFISNDHGSTKLERMFFGVNKNDNPFIYINSNTIKSINPNQSLGFKVSAEIYILSAETNPYYIIKTFKNKIELNQRNIYVGKLIDEVNKWQKVEVEIDSRVKCQEIDSISVEFQEGNTFTKGRRFAAKAFTY